MAPYLKSLPRYRAGAFSCVEAAEFLGVNRSPPPSRPTTGHRRPWPKECLICYENRTSSRAIDTLDLLQGPRLCIGHAAIWELGYCALRECP
jgi:hypothetical protein